MQNTRYDLALAYHILAELGLDDHTYTHLSARVLNEEAFYIYPFGMRFEEVTPESLLKVSFDGTVLEGAEYQYNQTGYIIHGTLYKARPDLNAIFHLHTPATVAVSATQEGLLPISQWALHFHDGVAYHDYATLALTAQQGTKIAEDLADKNILFMRHHGTVTAGKTLAEALFYTYHLEQACKTQCLAQGMHTPLRSLDATLCRKAVRTLLNFEDNLGARDWEAWARKLGHKLKRT